MCSRTMYLSKSALYECFFTVYGSTLLTNLLIQNVGGCHVMPEIMLPVIFGFLILATGTYFVYLSHKFLNPGLTYEVPFWQACTTKLYLNFRKTIVIYLFLKCLLSLLLFIILN